MINDRGTASPKDHDSQQSTPAVKYHPGRFVLLGGKDARIVAE